MTVVKYREPLAQFNGWGNRETWLVARHIQNTESLFNRWNQLLRASEAVGHSEFQLSCTLEGWIRGDLLGKAGTLSHDLLSAALDQVDWEELAKDLQGD